jgi:hypothetical protein
VKQEVADRDLEQWQGLMKALIIMRLLRNMLVENGTIVRGRYPWLANWWYHVYMFMRRQASGRWFAI